MTPGRLSAIDLKIEFGSRKNTFVAFHAKQVEIRFDSVSALSKHFNVRKAVIDGLIVSVIEGDGRVQSSDRDSALRLTIQNIQVKNANFAYTREHLKKLAKIRVKDISATVPSFSTHPAQTKWNGNATGVLEESGKFTLAVDTTVENSDLTIGVELNITGQNLSDLNPFFFTDDGIKLNGQLISGKAVTKVQNRTIHATVSALYKDFDVEILPYEERSQLSAFFQNFLASMKTTKQNVKGHFDRTSSTVLKRKPNQSIVSLILEGMKVAALDVSSKGNNE